MCTTLFPTNLFAYLSVVGFIAWHNQLDHSGIHFEGELPYMPSTKYQCVVAAPGALSAALRRTDATHARPVMTTSECSA